MKHTETFLDNYETRKSQEDSMALGFEMLFLLLLDLAVDKDKAMEVA